MFRRVLILGDGTAGAENQAKALWKRLGSQINGGSERQINKLTTTSPEIVRILPKNKLYKSIPPAVHIFLWKCLCKIPMLSSFNNILWFGYNYEVIEAILYNHENGYPDLVIGCGRLTAPINTFIRFNSKSTTFNIQIQHPRVSPKYFNRIITPKHDLTGNKWFRPEIARNVDTIPGSLHGIDMEWVTQGKKKWDDLNCVKNNEKNNNNQDQIFCSTVIIGGQHKNCIYDENDVKKMISTFITNHVLNGHETILYIICSRRTSENILKMLDSIQFEYKKNVSIRIWRNSELDGIDNPYQMALSMSSKIIVTGDSISMMTECMAINQLKKNSGMKSDLYIAFKDKVKGKHLRFLVENNKSFS